MVTGFVAAIAATGRSKLLSFVFMRSSCSVIVAHSQASWVWDLGCRIEILTTTITIT